MAEIVVYTYAKCSTCRDAVKWLQRHGLVFEERPIRETPPAETELRKMLAAQGGQIRRLFNTSGLDYRAMGLAGRMDSISEADAFALLRGNGNLVKRPFLLGPRTALAGFDEKAWAAALLQG
ncbi:MAG TPA: Spx/MgsR family RNA polymerase-binding regulatory protein [Opitutaceae bacterium]|nr:Spx/MgsR family RNA polymerase-binding regulatory protein [Opitutaceae bacterium]